MTGTVLVVEDDPRIAEVVVKNLDAAGFTCTHVSNGDHAWEAFLQSPPDLFVLDIMIPGADGLELTRRIRTKSQAPILLLTARAEEADKVLGFEIGADDYLTKPFSTRELVARVRALLRRSQRTEVGERLLRGRLVIDPERREVLVDDRPVVLTSLEFDLLHFMAHRPGRVYSRDDLMHQVWGERIVDDRSIDSLVSRLRRKLEKDPANPEYLQTVWGAGYRFSEAAP